ncbi:unnamed protein product [Symbiodinium natans]|uniref:Uncharacterized protein n=1 Tax=Symbiodinium natans TaxID=878477 RepID=A0A812MZX3_9DINO|nr:unnamed protein product [Symbiodinium natans]
MEMALSCLASPWRGRLHSVSPPPCRGPVPNGPSGFPPTTKRHFHEARAEQTSLDFTPPPRNLCALTPSVVAPWLVVDLPEKPVEKADKAAKRQELAGSPKADRSMRYVEKKEVQRHLQFFSVPNLEITAHKGARELRHSASLDAFGIPSQSQAKSGKAKVAKTADGSMEEDHPAPDFYVQQQRPTRGLPVKATSARLTGPALRALAELEAVDAVDAKRERPDRRRVSFKPSKGFKTLVVKEEGDGDLTKTSAQSLTTTTGASHQASQASLASSSSMHEVPEVSPMAAESDTLPEAATATC